VNSAVRISRCQWIPRNLQILCHEHNQEKMTKFDDWRPLWARVLMPVRDTPAAYCAETHTVRLNTTTPTPLRPCMCSRLVARILSHLAGRPRRRATRSRPPAVLHKACKSNPEPVDHKDHWSSPATLGRLTWDAGVVLAVVSLLPLVARIVAHCMGFKWR
jgi:hypothetical protein